MSCRKANAPGTHPKAYLLTTTLSVLAGILACCGSMLFFSWMMCNTTLPLFAAAPLSTAAVSAGALVTGVILSAAYRKNRLIWGLLSGSFYTVALFLAALLAGQREFLPSALLKPACILLAGCIGGVLSGVSSAKSTRKRAMKAK